MIKPASGSCNMRCKYCFYHDVAKNREMPSHGAMSLQTMETIVKKAFAYASGSPVYINFQGGEPLLIGKQFFKATANMIARTNIKKSPVFLGLQTNGTLIDDEWCEIFKANDFLVGLSLDGDEIANANRIDKDGNPTFDKIMASAQLLQKHDVNFNILTVLTRDVAMRIGKIYPFFTSHGFKRLQFIPCLKPLSGEIENPDFYLNEKSYTLFLLSAFALYQKDMAEGNYTSIRQFDNFVRLAHFERAEQCGMNGHCTHQFVIEADGAVYPCDFYCTDEYLLGNILEKDFFTLEHSPVAINFIKESLVVDEACKSCEYYMLCKGGCKRERRDVERCKAYKTFFKFALPYLKNMS